MQLKIIKGLGGENLRNLVQEPVPQRRGELFKQKAVWSGALRSLRSLGMHLCLRHSKMTSSHLHVILELLQTQARWQHVYHIILTVLTTCYLLNFWAPETCINATASTPPAPPPTKRPASEPSSHCIRHLFTTWEPRYLPMSFPVLPDMVRLES